MNNSYDDGRAGNPIQADTNLESYNRGVRDREHAEAAWGPPKPKPVPVPGIAYTLILVAPFIYLVYPVLGVTLLGVFAAVLVVFNLTPLPVVAEALAGLILCVAAFFPGLRLEAKASQFRLYRAWRTTQRLVLIPAVGVGLASGVDLENLSRFQFRLPPAETFLASLVIALVVHFVFRVLDRLYFPVWAQVEKAVEMEKKQLPSRRPIFKRALYSALWLIPVMMASHLAIRLLAGTIAEDTKAFYQDYSALVYVFDLALWLLLCLTGILPGTAKHRRSFVDNNVLLAARSGEAES
jgi:hypothetical protein